jgi:hypothetical protein
MKDKWDIACLKELSLLTCFPTELNIHSHGMKHGEENHIKNTTKQKEELGGTKDILHNRTSGGTQEELLGKFK